MRAISYLDFDLQILRNGASYRAQVLFSPGGNATIDFSPPFSDLELENFYLRMGQGRVAMRGADSPDVEAIEKVGGSLFNSVFRDEILACWRGSLNEALRADAGLRIRLRLTGTPELADLPWEFLFNPAQRRFLSISSTTPLVRYLEMPEPIRPLTVAPPVRVLVMIASPSDYPRLDVEQEWYQLQRALKGPIEQGALVLERLEGASISALQHLLRVRDFHIFHFIGHAFFDQKAQDGYLLLEDSEGRGRPVRGQDLGVLLHDHSPMRLAVLNACEGGRAARTDPFGGVAQSLSLQGLPAVIAMQFKITDEAAILFAQEFYSAVADGYPVDAALASSRFAIFSQGWSPEWGTPVLYLRAPDGKIFDVQRKPPPPGPPPPDERVEVGSKPSQPPAPVETAQDVGKPVATTKKADLSESTAGPPVSVSAPQPWRRRIRQVLRWRPPVDFARVQGSLSSLIVGARAGLARQIDSLRLGFRRYARFLLIGAVGAALLAAIVVTVKLWPKPSIKETHMNRPPSSPDAVVHLPAHEVPANPVPPGPESSVSSTLPAHIESESAKAPPKPPERPKPVTISEQEMMAMLMNKVTPVYPVDAQKAGIQGTVKLNALISREGVVEALEPVSGPPELFDSAVAAVRQWRFQPKTAKGNPVEVKTTVEVAFVITKPASEATVAKPQPAVPAPCNFGSIQGTDDGSRLILLVPYVYQGKYPLETVAMLGVPLKADGTPVPGLTYTQSTLKSENGTAMFSVESRPSLKKSAEESELLRVLVIVKATNETVCSQTIKYSRKW